MTPIAFTASRLGLGIALTASIAWIAPAQADDDDGPTIDFKGLIDFRGVISSPTQSWEDGGLGKTRYGGTADGDRRVLGTIGEATLIMEPQITWDLSGFVQLTADPEQHTTPDVIEAYLQYKPAPTGPWGLRIKAGAFFPPISLENSGLGWTSPYTISSSALNTWVGEELRTIGGEATVLHRSQDLELSLTGAVFGYNEPTGTLLAWRGWDISDRLVGLFDHLRLPALPEIGPQGLLYKQQPYDQPFRQIDDRAGYYAAGKIDLRAYGSLTLMRYDNNTNNRTFANGEWPWRTAFWSTGLSIPFTSVDLLGQFMTGKTSLITLPNPIGPLVYTDFKAAYGLISKSWGNNRVSFRYDWFYTDGDDLFVDTYERGHALTFAYIYRPAARQRLTFEILYIDSDRSERETLGLPERARESQFQISYRFFL